ncbi:Carotenoid/retinoid oxidoreductase,Amine oxidase,FAD/NAD(P)-binding domain [Cinara cedri]|uniref:Phytoene desaturase n=1 Tax=Cinara cedri TaxID=506608 RepID=A0A5E4NA50_9HEMI|nr:Carotenoid/retinoid oxidoreductase,Amine oxidase,FAD/NAD(P)-binding domain [Cinara cedri]
MAIKIIIVGAGVGGTAAAARLSKKGFQVEVYEKNSYNGGRCSLIHHNGYRFDQGPSLYLMPKIFEETFADLGEDINNHIDLLKCPSNYTVHFHDGKQFELTTDLSRLSRSLEKYEGEGESTLINFLNFVKESHVHYKRSVKVALKTDFQHWYDFFHPKHIPDVLKLHLLDTVYNRACKYFKSDYMRKAFTFQTMYLGMSPYDGIAPYNLLQYTEIAEGIWYPKGGFNTVLQSLETIAVNYGAKFNYNSDVQEIIIDERGVAKGIKLNNGDTVDGDIVICNADLVYAYNKLLPKTSYAEKLRNKQFTSSSISFYWSMNEIIPQMAVHNIFLAEHYKPSFDQIFKDHTLPDFPSFYINVPSRIDPTAAPEDKDTIVVLVPVGHISNNPDIDFDKLIKRAREQVIDTIETRLKISNFKNKINHEIINDPRSWQNEFNLWKGSILGLTHSLFQVLWFRPSIKCKIFKNLYFVGASVQPGTGVPIVLCGAKLLEKQLCETFLEGKIEDLNVWAKCLSFLIGLLGLLIFWFFFN